MALGREYRNLYGKKDVEEGRLSVCSKRQESEGVMRSYLGERERERGKRRERESAGGRKRERMN
jgi:hypothetical protein